jgi:hypothetical protein
MVNNKAHFQFSATQDKDNLVIKCYHSTNKIVISVSNITNYINYESLHDPRHEVLSWSTLVLYLSHFPHHRKITYEILLHLFLSK